jgi:hypothetical protein
MAGTEEVEAVEADAVAGGDSASSNETAQESSEDITI